MSSRRDFANKMLDAPSGPEDDGAIYEIANALIEECDEADSLRERVAELESLERGRSGVINGLSDTLSAVDCELAVARKIIRKLVDHASRHSAVGRDPDEGAVMDEADSFLGVNNPFAMDPTLEASFECIRLRGERQGRISERGRIMQLFGEIGEELMENAKSLDRFEGERLECRARMHAGMCVSDVAQILFTEIRSEDFHEKTSKIVRDMRSAMGAEEWEKAKQESEDILNLEKMMHESTEVGDIVSQKTLEETEFYDVVAQEVQTGSKPGDTVTMISVLNKQGDYAGAAEDMRKFFDDHGIAPEMRNEDSSVCCIGWSENEQKYYGWSHRAVRGYAKGDKSFDGSHIIEDKADARRSACAFAEDVS